MTDKNNKCRYCKNTFATGTNLISHQRRAKYCLKIQGKDKLEVAEKYECVNCGDKFTMKDSLRKHQKACDGDQRYEELTAEYNEVVFRSEDKDKVILNQKEEIIKLKSQLEYEIKSKDDIIKSKDDIIKTLEDKFEKQIELLTSQINLTRDAHSDLSQTLAKRATTQNTLQNINITQNLAPLDFESFKGCEENLTIEHHKRGAEGYATFATEGPLKGRLVVTDKSRGIFKYKDKDGTIRTDPGMEKIMDHLCDSIKRKSYQIACDHYSDIENDFGSNEMEACPTMDWAIAIGQYKHNKGEAKFVKDIIKGIAKVINDTRVEYATPVTVTPSTSVTVTPATIDVC